MQTNIKLVSAIFEDNNDTDEKVIKISKTIILTQIPLLIWSFRRNAVGTYAIIIIILSNYLLNFYKRC